jgi:leader peptidase (prepilin peptidase)/N-methyltransferase
VIFAGVLGACIGSFLNVVIWRLPRGESVAKGRSHCPKCGHLIRGYDNVPVLSWLLLRARCRDCHAPISARYPLVEALTCALFVLAALRFPFPDETVVAAVKAAALSALVCVSFVDIDRREIPDAITKPGIIAGLALSFLVPALHSPEFLHGFSNRHLASFFESAAGVATGAGVLLVVRWLGRLMMGKEAMGLGDVKLLAMVGAFLHPFDVMLVLLVGSVGGAVLGGVYVAVRARRLAPVAGTLKLGERDPVAFAVARVRAPRRSPITVAVPVRDASATEVKSDDCAFIELTLPGETVWSDDGKDVRLALRGVVVGHARGGGEDLVVVRPEPLSDTDEEWLATFALNRISIPFGVFLALGAAAVLLFSAEITHFVLVSWPHFVLRR